MALWFHKRALLLSLSAFTLVGISLMGAKVVGGFVSGIQDLEQQRLNWSKVAWIKGKEEAVQSKGRALTDDLRQMNALVNAGSAEDFKEYALAACQDALKAGGAQDIRMQGSFAAAAEEPSKLSVKAMFKSEPENIDRILQSILQHRPILALTAIDIIASPSNSSADRQSLSVTAELQVYGAVAHDD